MRFLQFWRSILLVVRLLLLADPAQVPEDHATVVAAASEDGLLERVPGERRHGVLVALERVEPGSQVPQVPDRDGLVGRSRRQDEL